MHGALSRHTYNNHPLGDRPYRPQLPCCLCHFDPVWLCLGLWMIEE
jgi:hypothetical protein